MKASRVPMSHRGTSPAGALLRRLLRAQLRLKVMVGVVVVTLVALAAFDVGAVATMRRYLLTQTDKNLQVALTLTTPGSRTYSPAVLRPVIQGDITPCPRNTGRRPDSRLRRSLALSTSSSCRAAARR